MTWFALTEISVPGMHHLGWDVLRVDPPRVLVLGSKSLPKGIYTFYLEALNDTKSRLITRDRTIWPWCQRPFMFLLFEPLHAYMETGVLAGIRARVERSKSHALAGSDNIATGAC